MTLRQYHMNPLFQIHNTIPSNQRTKAIIHSKSTMTAYTAVATVLYAKANGATNKKRGVQYPFSFAEKALKSNSQAGLSSR